MTTFPTPVPNIVAAIIIARKSGHHVAEEYEELLTQQALDVAVTVAPDNISPDGLYPEGPVPCELLLYCDGSVACYPDSTATTLRPAVVEQRAQWERALKALDIDAPQSAEDHEDFEEWLAVMRDEATVYAHDMRKGISELR